MRLKFTVSFEISNKHVMAIVIAILAALALRFLHL